MCIRDRSATAAQMSTLADANKSVEEAAKAENSNTEDTTTKNNTDKSEKKMCIRDRFLHILWCCSICQKVACVGVSQLVKMKSFKSIQFQMCIRDRAGAP